MRRIGGHVRILVRTRLRALRNRLFSEGGVGSVPVVLSVVGLLAVVVAFGHLAAPALLVPPDELAAGLALGGREVLVRGTGALEAAFWLTALAAAVTSFRVMEILYRRRDLRAVDALPVELPALYLDRLLASLLEAALIAVVGSAFFIPLIWHGAPRVAAICALVVWTGLAASSIVSMAVQLAAGEMNVRAASDGESRDLGGAYGGPGQIFIFSPGIALAACAIVVLLARLAAGELLVGGESLRGFVFGYGVVGVVVAISLVDSFRRFVADFPRMAARFREADAVQYEAHLDYQTSAYRESLWYESLVPEAARPPLRAAALQYGRAHMLTRYSYVIGWVLAGLALSQWSRSAFPPWAVVVAPAVVAATLANPWQRLVVAPLRPTFARYLPITDEANTAAMLAIAARELLVLAVPYAALVLWVDWGSAAGGTVVVRAAVAVALPLAINGAMAVVWRISEPGAATALVVPLLAVALAVAVGIVSVPVLAGCALIGALAQAAPMLGAAKPRAAEATRDS